MKYVAPPGLAILRTSSGYKDFTPDGTEDAPTTMALPFKPGVRVGDADNYTPKVFLDNSANFKLLTSFSIAVSNLA